MTLVGICFQFGDAIDREIFKTRLKMANSVDDGFRQMTEEDNIAFYWSKATIDSLAKAHQCQYKSVPAFSYTIPYSMVIKKASPYKEILNHQ